MILTHCIYSHISRVATPRNTFIAQITFLQLSTVFNKCISISKCDRCADSESMLSCVKPKVLAYITDAVKQDRLAITEDLAVVKSRDASEDNAKKENYPAQYDTADPTKRKLLRKLMLEKLDAYLSSHQLEAKLPEAIAGSNIVPRSLVDSMPKSLTVPLSDSPSGQGNRTLHSTFSRASFAFHVRLESKTFKFVKTFLAIFF